MRLFSVVVLWIVMAGLPAGHVPAAAGGSICRALCPRNRKGRCRLVPPFFALAAPSARQTADSVRQTPFRQRAERLRKSPEKPDSRGLLVTKLALRIAGASALALFATGALAQEVTIYQPGAPGSEGKAIDAAVATKLADTRYSPDDVAFLQSMIHHHQQAVDMAELVEARTNRLELREAAGRIKASQNDEIKFMRDWLTTRGEHAPEPGMGHDHGAHEVMKGMASAADMAALKTLNGTDFDRKFLTLMIAHHKGAVKMVEQLLAQPGSACSNRVHHRLKIRRRAGNDAQDFARRGLLL